MKAMIVLSATVLLALAGTSAWLAASPEGSRMLPAVLSGLIVFVGTTVSGILSRRRRAAAQHSGRAR